MGVKSTSKRERNIFSFVRQNKLQIGKVLEEEMKVYESDKVDSLKELYTLLEQLEKTIVEMFRTKGDSFERLLLYYENDLSNIKSAKILEIKPNTFNRQLARMSDQVIEKFGDEIYSAIVTEDIGMLKMLLVMQDKGVKLIDFMLTEFVASLPQPKVDYNIDLSDCTKEISVLKLYSSQMMRRQIADCDLGKLSHLLSLLQSGGGANVLRRKILEDYLKGELLDEQGKEISYSNYTQMLKNEGF